VPQEAQRGVASRGPESISSTFRIMYGGDTLDTVIGEAFVGDDQDVAHIVLAIGSKGTPFETSFMDTLTHRSRGHTSSLALLEPNLPCKPFALVCNEMTMRTSEQASLFLGPVNASVARAVIDSVADGTIPKESVEDLLIIVTAFIHWEAKTRQKVYDNNYAATILAIERAFNGEPGIDDIIGKRDSAVHFFYPSPSTEDRSDD
jgi:5,6,7,8-tetrahydromethanopterin hydro-lyase